MVFRIMVQQYALSPFLLQSLTHYSYHYFQISQQIMLYIHIITMKSHINGEINTYDGMFVCMTTPLDVNVFESLLNVPFMYIYFV